MNATEKNKHDVPIDHLDYSYVSKCSDLKELEKILRVLRSGKEGIFPHLEEATEERIKSINPQSRILVKDQPIWSTNQLGSEGKALTEEFDQWTSDLNSTDEALKSSNKAGTQGSSLPPVRGCSSIHIADKGDKGSDEGKSKSTKRPLPRSQKEWDKVDVEAELKKLDEVETSEEPATKPSSNVMRRPAKPNIPLRIDSAGLTEDEMRFKAEKEKEKGNEAFRSNDYEEAVLYYTRSLSLISSVPAVNNRAQAYVKLEKWEKAILDCNVVLQHEPNNLKAFLRRSVAYKGMRQYKEAKKDLERILAKEPNNKRAQNLLDEVETALEEQKKKGRRMVIEEVSEDEEEEDSADETDIVVGKPRVPAESDVITSEENEGAESVANEHITKEQTVGVEEIDTNEITDEHDLKKEAVQQVLPEETKQPVEDSQSKPEVESMPNTQSEQVPESVTPSVQEKQEMPTPPPPLSAAMTKLKEEGNQLFRTGRHAAAIEKYSKIINKLENDDSQAQNLAVLYSNRAACKTKIGDPSGCIEDCNFALTLTPHNVKALLRRAIAYEEKEKYRQAYVDYRHALSIDHSIDIAQQGSSRLQSALKAQDGAKWREKLPPISSVSRSSLPPRSHPQKVVPIQEKVVPVEEKVVQEPSVQEQQESNEKLYEKHKTEGNDCVKKNKFQEAIECYSKCIQLDATKAAAFTNRALCFLRLNKAEAVLNDCNKALQLEPGNIKALFRRAQAHKMQKDFTASERDLELVLTLDKSNAAARRELKVVHNYLAEEKAKKLKEEQLTAKGRRKIQIEEVGSSDEEEEEQDTAQAQTAEPIKSQDTHKIEQTSQSNSTSQSKDSVPDNKSKEKHSEESANSDTNQTYKKSQSMQNGEADTSEQAKIDEVTAKSEVKGTQGMGVTYDMKASKTSSKIRPTATKTDVKATPYEFMSAWTALKNTKDTEPYFHILQQVQPEQLPAVISNKLEGDMLQRIVECVTLMGNAGEKQKGFDYMRYLTKVPRFQMNTMFMSDKEKKEVKAAIGSLAGEISEAELKTLGKQYGV